MHDGTITLRLANVVWLATGVAVALIAVTVFAGFRSEAATTPDATTYVPVAPCRLVDTRPGSQVGPRGTPIQAGEIHEQPVTGTNGACTIPDAATAVSLNVTVVRPTAASYLTVFPFGSSVPTASNLNYAPGGPPTFNKVDVQLDPEGRLGFFNLAGTVDLVVDVNGYYSSSALDSIEAITSGLEARISALESQVVEQAKRPTFAMQVAHDGTKLGTGDHTVSHSLTGRYLITIDLSDYEIPYDGIDARVPAAVASPWCPNHTTRVAQYSQAKIAATGFWSFVVYEVLVVDGNGSLANCTFNMVVNFGEANPFHLGL